LVTQQLQQITAKVLNNQTGATAGTLGSRMGTWLPAARAANPNFKLVGAPIPTLRKGDPITFQTNIDIPFVGAGAAITGSSKNVELAARLLDWGYSPAGRMYYNFGTEGESYTMVNGEPIYTPLVMKNPQGRSIGQSLAAYIRATDSIGPLIQDGRYQQQYFSYPEQKGAVTVWAGAKITKYTVPPVTPTPEESREYAQIMSEITTYRNEMFVKYILGTESLSNWNTFVSTVNRMGLDRALAIQNAALTRYNAR
jgi:putative aldouronate transport system substrate-binding protein